jgi:hypothetical protein
MNAASILAEFKPLGSDGYKRVLFNHGVSDRGGIANGRGDRAGDREPGQ